MSTRELLGKVRGLARRVTLKGIKDDGQLQTATVEVAEGAWRENVEILQPYGFASHVPEDGALALAIAVGGDEGDLVLLPVANPSARMGGMSAGDVGLYNQFGDKLVIGADGTINLQAGSSATVKVDDVSLAVSGEAIVMKAGGVTVTVSSEGLTIEGGPMKHDGVNVGSDHRHIDVRSGTETSGPPQSS